MKEAFEYYVMDKRLFVLDTASHYIVYFNDGNWYEECVIEEELLKKSDKITETEALKISKGNDPTGYIEFLIKEDLYKSIYCP